MLGILAIVLWYISIPLILIWYIWKKTTWDKKKKMLGTAIACILFVPLIALHVQLNKPPVLVVTEPENGFTTGESRISIKGTVEPGSAKITINDFPVTVKSGTFEQLMIVNDESNTFTLRAVNGSGITQQTLIVNRTFTEEERAEYEERKAKEEAEVEAQKRKEMIERQFSQWDGVHIRLEETIKQSMNDPKSYEHVKTQYWDMKDHLIVNMTFRGKNAFGGVVQNTVKAKVSIDGTDIEILEQY